MTMASAILALLVATVLGLFAYYAGPWIPRMSRMKRIRQRAVEKRALILTYDDGPSNELTPRVLDILQKYGARATFFVLGQNASRNPSIVDRIIREGHQIGCHSDRHLNAWKVSPRRALTDIASGYKQLSRWVSTSAAYRPPYGKMTAATYWWLFRHKISVVWWTLDSGDTYEVIPPIAHITESLRKERGGVVLFHDLDRTPLRNAYVLEATKALLDTAKRESFQVIPLSEVYP